MMGFGILIPILILAALAYALGWLPPNRQYISPDPGRERETGASALEILKTRYARGEITKAEYEEMRKELNV